MVRIFLSFGIAVSFLAATPASAALELEPSSEWQLRQYDDKCRMTRKFGDGEDNVTLWIDKGGSGRYVNLTAIGRPFRSPYGSRTKISFQPGEPINRGFLRSTSSKGRPVLTMFGVAPIEFAKLSVAEKGNDDSEETVDLKSSDDSEFAPPEVLEKRYNSLQSLNLSGALVQEVSLKTGGMGTMMQQLQQCATKLIETRSKTPAGETKKGKGARDRDTATWAQKIQANYPTYLLKEMAQSTVGVRVQINPEGRATFCEVLQHSGPAGFNDAACLAMIRYSRFHPAINEDGDPVWGTYQTRVTYRIN
ncbi:energy transducer TonB [Erythrobacter crassostreae]|uniref:TonB family protein n=1 Tax=Erythrobacter crassostreae TaxID=2828328 RepID=A0A9X1JK23_9SPHN|nr:energy transducer TonB [Erythrobacter crassostrea]MBV7258491.1 TonB family protein [Erythrobacter crassostrea]